MLSHVILGSISSTFPYMSEISIHSIKFGSVRDALMYILIKL
jgi:hypothetical protein